MFNCSIGQYNRNQFFKDISITLGITSAYILLDIFIKWLGSLTRYSHYNDLSDGDWRDIGSSTSLCFAILAISLMLKNLFIEAPKQAYELKQMILPALPAVALFALDLFLKLVTDFHNEKDQFEVTSREIKDSSFSSLLFFSLLMMVTLGSEYHMAKHAISMREDKILIDHTEDEADSSYNIAIQHNGI